MGYPPHPSGNPYAVPHQNADGNFNPYAPQYQMPYPPAQPNPPFNPYQVKEGNWLESLHGVTIDIVSSGLFIGTRIEGIISIDTRY